MQLLVIPLLVIIAAFGLFYAGDFLGTLDLRLPGLEDAGFRLRGIGDNRGGRETAPAISQRPPPQASAPAPFSLDTRITEGPANNSILYEDTTVTFQFSGSVFPAETQGAIGFETEVEDIDEAWVPARGNSRTITLPSEPREYIFFVRSTLKGFADTTPASRVFRINTSRYFGKVRISKVTAPRTNRASLISLTANLAKGETLNVSGWTLKATTDEYTIPQALADFAAFDVALFRKEDIILRSGTKLLISGANNPLANNMHYRPNQCFGELKKEGRSFPLKVPGECTKVPKPSLKEISHLSVSCQDYILKNTGKSCEFPAFENTRTVTSDTACFLHLQTMEERFEQTSGYGYCYRQRSLEPGFFSNEWHIYTEGEEFLRPGHDRLTLHDESNLFVDEFLY